MLSINIIFFVLKIYGRREIKKAVKNAAVDCKTRLQLFNSGHVFP